MMEYEDATDCPICPMVATDRDYALAEAEALRAELAVLRPLAEAAERYVVALHEGFSVIAGQALNDMRSLRVEMPLNLKGADRIIVPVIAPPKRMAADTDALMVRDDGSVEGFGDPDAQYVIKFLYYAVTDGDSVTVVTNDAPAEVGIRCPVALAEIDEQRTKGWPDFHPEDYCHRCGAPNISWFVDSDRFNMAMGPHESHQWNGIVCPACFVDLHEATTGLHCTWQLVPGSPFRPTREVGCG